MRLVIGDDEIDAKDLSDPEISALKGDDLFFLQFDALHEARAALQAIGVAPSRYHGGNVVLAAMTAEQARSLKQKYNTVAIARFLSAWKIDPELKDGNSEERVTVSLSYVSTKRSELAEAIRKAGGEITQLNTDDEEEAESSPQFDSLDATLARNAIADLAALPYVCDLEKAYEHVPLAPMDHLGDSGITGLRAVQPNLRGTGEIVAVSDTGADPTHPEFAGKAIYNKALYGDLGTIVGDYDDYNGHGTHCAGLVLGATVGAAPDAELINFVYLRRKFGGIPVYSSELFKRVYGPGRNTARPPCRIMSMSYGANGSTTYGTSGEESRKVDNYLYSHPDFTAVIAAGNEAGKTNLDPVRFPRVADPATGALVTTRTINRPGTAANAITVGALNNAFRIAPFSSRGALGVIKPDIVAPGTEIRSSVPTAVDPTGFQEMQGTSMATPIVAGAVAVLRQFIRTHPHSPEANPPSTLIKSLLIAGAEPVHGYAIGDAHQGWGRLQLERTIHPANPIDYRWFIAPGSVPRYWGVRRDYRFTHNGGELKIVLSWLEPGHKFGADLANRFHVYLAEVDVNGNDTGVYYRANNFTNNFSTQLNAVPANFDMKNNVNVIYLGIPFGQQTRFRLHVGLEHYYDDPNPALVIWGDVDFANLAHN